MSKNIKKIKLLRLESDRIKELLTMNAIGKITREKSNNRNILCLVGKKNVCVHMDNYIH